KVLRERQIVVLTLCHITHLVVEEALVLYGRSPAGPGLHRLQPVRHGIKSTARHEAIPKRFLRDLAGRVLCFGRPDRDVWRIQNVGYRLEDAILVTVL